MTARTRFFIVAAVFLTAAVAGSLAGTIAGPTPAPAATPQPTAPADPSRADRLADQLVRERAAHDRKVEKLAAALRAARSRPDYIWWSTGDTRQVAEAVWDERGVSETDRARWRCIINRESGWRHDVWYGGARGWQPEYTGSDRVNGLLQLRPFWAWWWLAGMPQTAPRHDASLTTYRVTSDPVTSLRISLRIGFKPFFAQEGSCL